MEYRKRCKVCGKIWCYTDDDLHNDSVNNVTGAINAIGGIASALGGNVFQRQYFADRMENDERKRVNRNQCPDCRSLDCESISAEEWEDYKVQESFSKVQVSINSNATTDSLLKRAKLLLEDGDWASANAYCDNVLDADPENGIAYLYKLMAELRVKHQEDLRDRPEPFDGKPNYQKVMRYADELVKNTLSSYLEYINERNENARLEDIYSDACILMNTAKSEVFFKEAATLFGAIVGYKDAEAMQKKCMEKAEQARIEAEHRAAAEKAKKTKTTIILAIVVVIAAVGAYFAFSSSQKAAAYNEAIALEESGDYKAAIKAFIELGDYEDSTLRAGAIQEEKYKKIFELLDDGKYDVARELCRDLGAYKDCPELDAQIKTELESLITVYNIETIDDKAIETAKKVRAENEYVKNDYLFTSKNYLIYSSLHFFERLHNVEWECVSGDNRTLSMAWKDSAERQKSWPTIITQINEKSGWDGFRTLRMQHDEQVLSMGVSTGSTCYYDSATLTCEWSETAFGGANYTVTLTEQGTLHIIAERNDGEIFECEYKRVD